MWLSKTLIIVITFLLLGTPAFTQDQEVQDTMLIIDSLADLEPELMDDETVISQYPQAPAVGDSVSFRTVNDSIAATLKKQKAFEYANDPEYWIKEKSKPVDYDNSFWVKLARFFSRPAVRTFIFLLLVAFVVFVVVKVIIVNKLYIFKSGPKNKKTEAVSEEAALMAEDLDALIQEATARGDRRAVIRFLYLKTLKLLDKKGWITFHPQSTNTHYRTQVNNYAKGKDFGFLSSAYEYVWYGNFLLNEEQFQIIVHNFNHFQNSLKV